MSLFCFKLWVGASPSVEHLKGTSRAGLSLTENIRHGWKGLPGTNTLNYHENPQITTVKSFIGLASGACTTKCYSFVIYGKWTDFVTS